MDYAVGSLNFQAGSSKTPEKTCDPRSWQRNYLKQRANISRRIIGITGITFGGIYKKLRKR
jgi:hypothetical protein